MATPRDYQAELRQIRQDILHDIDTQMERIGRNLSEKDGINFFSYSNVCDWLMYIKKDGLIITDVGPRDFDHYLDEGIISVTDIASLLNELQEFEKPDIEQLYAELVANHGTEAEIYEKLCERGGLTMKQAYDFMKTKTKAV